MKNLILFVLLAVSSCIRDPFCNEHNADETAGVVKVLDQQYIAYLQNDGDMGRNGIKISTSTSYRNLFSHCCGDKLDSIDFVKYDILGLSTVNNGQNSTYFLEVQRDDLMKKITYIVTERYCKKSSPVDGRSNFVIVPKIPSEYTIDYQRK